MTFSMAFQINPLDILSKLTIGGFDAQSGWQLDQTCQISILELSGLSALSCTFYQEGWSKKEDGLREWLLSFSLLPLSMNL